MGSEAAAAFQREIAAMGYRFQFVTLAGFHSLNLSMFKLANDYRDRGMGAYCDLQQAEFAAEARRLHRGAPPARGGGGLLRRGGDRGPRRQLPRPRHSRAAPRRRSSMPRRRRRRQRTITTMRTTPAWCTATPGRARKLGGNSAGPGQGLKDPWPPVQIRARAAFMPATNRAKSVRGRAPRQASPRSAGTARVSCARSSAAASSRRVPTRAPSPPSGPARSAKRQSARVVEAALGWNTRSISQLVLLNTTTIGSQP